MTAVHTDDFEGFSQYLVSKRSFKQGQAFSLYNFDTSVGFLAVRINPFSFGGNEEHPTIDQYLSVDTGNNRYVVLQDFRAESIYLKFKYESDEIYISLAN